MTSLTNYIKKNHNQIYNSELIEFYKLYIISNTSINITKDILVNYNILDTFDNYKRLVKKSIKNFNLTENIDYKLENNEYVISPIIYNFISTQLQHKSILFQYNNIITKFQTELIQNYQTEIEKLNTNIRDKMSDILYEINDKQYYQREYAQIYKNNIKLQKELYNAQLYDKKSYKYNINIIKKIKILSEQLLHKRI